MRRTWVWLLFVGVVLSQAVVQEPNQAALLVSDPPQLALRAGFALTANDSSLYAAWVGLARDGSQQIHLSEIDPHSLERRRIVQLTQGKARGKGIRAVSDAVAIDGEVFTVWLENGYHKRRPWYYLVIGSLTQGEAGVYQPTVLDYGEFMSHPRFVQTSKGLFLVGYSQDAGRRRRTLRLYRYSEGTWSRVRPLSGPEFDGYEPSLLDADGRLALYWLQSKRIAAAYSEDGIEWTAPETAVAVEANSLQVATSPQGVDLTWVEPDSKAVKIWAKRFPKDGTSENAKKVVELAGLRGRVVLGFEGGTTMRVLLFSYYDPQLQSQMIGSALESQQWKSRILSPKERRFSVSSRPVLDDQGGAVLAGWRQGSESRMGVYKAEVMLSGLGEGDGPNYRFPSPKKGGLLSSPKFIDFEGTTFVSYFAFRSTGRGAGASTGDLLLHRLEASGEDKHEEPRGE